jgi:hypothetical protein
MENLKETYQKSEHTDNANATSHYRLMTIGIIIGLVGVMLRFTGSWAFIDIISNILFVIGSVISVKAVLNILK